LKHGKHRGFISKFNKSVNVLPQITFEITLAPDAVCSNPDGTGVYDQSNTSAAFSKTGASAATYKLSNLSLQVEVLNMASSVLDEIANQRIAQVGYLSLPFKNYFTYNSTHDQTSRANVNSASWDRLWVAYRDKSYTTQGAPVSVKGYKKKVFQVPRETEVRLEVFLIQIVKNIFPNISIWKKKYLIQMLILLFNYK